jgi:hypothetical protein
MRTLFFAAMLGCSRPTLDQAIATKETVPPTPKVEQHAEILLRVGDEITLDADGVLRAGSASTRIELARNEFFFPLQASLKLVSIDTGVEAILFTEPTSEGEDPPNRYRLFRKDGSKLEVVLDRVIGVYGVTPLTFSGKGTASYVEDGWTACERAKFPAKTDVHEVTLQFDANARWIGTKRVATKKRQDCRQLAG